MVIGSKPDGNALGNLFFATGQGKAPAVSPGSGGALPCLADIASSLLPEVGDASWAENGRTAAANVSWQNSACKMKSLSTRRQSLSVLKSSDGHSLSTQAFVDCEKAQDGLPDSLVARRRLTKSATN